MESKNRAFREGIEQGSLEAVLPQYRLPDYPLHAVHPATAYVPAKIRSFIDLMVETARSEPTLRAN